MKTIKAIGAAALLAFSLSIPAYADDPTPGEQHTPGSPIPAPDDTGTPLSENADPAGSSATNGEISSLNIADILWALGFDLLR